MMALTRPGGLDETRWRLRAQRVAPAPLTKPQRVSDETQASLTKPQSDSDETRASEGRADAAEAKDASLTKPEAGAARAKDERSQMLPEAISRTELARLTELEMARDCESARRLWCECNIECICAESLNGRCGTVQGGGSGGRL